LNLKRLLPVVALLLVATSMFAVPFMDGEKLTFDVKYGIVNAAQASIQVQTSLYQGKPVWYLSTNANTHKFFDKVFKIRDRVESWWDKETLLPYKFSKNLQEGNYKQHRVHIYNHSTLKSTYQTWNYKKSSFNNTVMNISPDTQDILSAFYSVRFARLVVGKSVFINITADGREMRTEVVVHKREKVNTIFGTANCLMIEPLLRSDAVFKQSGRILIWVTDDEYKIPVKMESKITIGSFVAYLTSASQVPLKIK